MAPSVACKRPPRRRWLVWWLTAGAALPEHATGQQLARPAAVPMGLDWAAVPVVNFNSDDGVGVGLTGTLYHRVDHERPYALALTLRLFATSNGLHSHVLRWDAPGFAGLPLRLGAELGYFALASAHYCGIGNGVTCDPAVAQNRIEALGLPSVQAEAARDSYYKLRYTRPYAIASARWQLVHGQQRLIEAFASWRGAWYLPGTWREDGPYPHSLYAQAHGGGERGMVSLVQTGLARDTRDVEAAPTEGTRAELSLRVALPLLGSSWSFQGVNMTTAGWWSPRPGLPLVLALRIVADAVWGAVPTGELSRVGGTVLYAAYGGDGAGRGLRQSRYLGEHRLFAQPEVRVTAWRGRLLARTIDLGAVAFADAGAVRSDEPGAVGGGGVHVGVGAGVRVTVNRDFVVRADVAAAAEEGWGPRLYLNLGHVY